MPEELTRDREEQRRHMADMIYQGQKLLVSRWKHYPVNLPAIIFHGTEDPICSCKATAAVSNQIIKLEPVHFRFKSWKGTRHDPHWDNDCQAIRNEYIHWIKSLTRHFTRPPLENEFPCQPHFLAPLNRNTADESTNSLLSKPEKKIQRAMEVLGLSQRHSGQQQQQPLQPEQPPSKLTATTATTATATATAKPTTTATTETTASASSSKSALTSSTTSAAPTSAPPKESQSQTQELPKELPPTATTKKRWSFFSGILSKKRTSQVATDPSSDPSAPTPGVASGRDHAAMVASLASTSQELKVEPIQGLADLTRQLELERQRIEEKRREFGLVQVQKEEKVDKDGEVQKIEEEVHKQEEEEVQKEEEEEEEEEEQQQQQEQMEVQKEEELNEEDGEAQKKKTEADEVQKEEEDVQKEEEDVQKEEEDVHKEEEDVHKEEEVAQKEEDVQRKEEEEGVHKEDVDVQKEEEAQEEEEEVLKEEGVQEGQKLGDVVDSAPASSGIVQDTAVSPLPLTNAINTDHTEPDAGDGDGEGGGDIDNSNGTNTTNTVITPGDPPNVYPAEGSLEIEQTELPEPDHDGEHPDLQPAEEPVECQQLPHTVLNSPVLETLVDPEMVPEEPSSEPAAIDSGSHTAEPAATEDPAHHLVSDQEQSPAEHSQAHEGGSGSPPTLSIPADDLGLERMATEESESSTLVPSDPFVAQLADSASEAKTANIPPDMLLNQLIQDIANSISNPLPASTPLNPDHFG
ncbi:hypothetical protein DFQ27_002892 [Actinomortierella ambigua]|uniref:Uncharacterized protein n=1 Tax=Actinomortierella ambigua TaxID=1343610 RepID=A0A9P6Q6F8_9FUNG|nr:hypothetical protein DFQ27_002892 [Actinomortierella ambigua]